MYLAGFLFLAFAAVIIILLFGPNGGQTCTLSMGTDGQPTWNSETCRIPSVNGWMSYICIVIGMISGMAIGKVTEYFTSFDYGPVISIKDRGMTGPATVVIQGLGVGMISCLPPVLVMVAAIMMCATI